MATTTPNFGWDIPQSTDLVKDGATAIAALGTDIDTALVDLKGGTTGQVLSKNSNTDLDFSWTNADPLTILDAKGDLISATAADTPARLASSGVNGDVLTVDTSTSTGLKWAAPAGGDKFAAGKNKIINGDFRINQRGFTSTTTAGTFGFDRWQIDFGNVGTTTYSAQTFTAGTAPVAGYEAVNFARIVTSGQTGSTEYTNLLNKMEDVRTFANQTVTVSFWAKAGSGTPKVAISLSQNFGTGGSATVDTYAGQATLSTSWARYSVTVAVPSISGKTIGTSSRLALTVWTSAGSTYNAQTGSLGLQSATIDLWGFQVEAGSTATDFQTATGTLAGELAACQRYYERMIKGSVDNAAGIGTYYNTTTIYLPIFMKVRKRVAPIFTASGTNILTMYVAGTARAATNIVTDAMGEDVASLTITTAADTAGRSGIAYLNNTGVWLEFSAEL